MNYIYKGKLYTIRKIDIKDFQQYEGKWYPTVFYENGEGLRFNRSVKEFFDKFELYKGYTREELEKDIKKALAKDSKLTLNCRHKLTLEDVKEDGELEEPQDLISLVLEKMPFLAREEFELENINEDIIAIRKKDLPSQEWYVHMGNTDNDLNEMIDVFGLHDIT